MKILHVADLLPDLHNRVGGAEFVTKRIIDEQLALGHQVEVITLPADKEPDLFQAHRHEMRHIDQYAPRAAYAIKQLFFPSDPRAAAGLQKALVTIQPDIVHYHNLHFSGLSVVHEARKQGIPSVWSVYDYWLFCPSFMLLTKDHELCQRGHGAHCARCVATRRLPYAKPIKQILFGLRKSLFERYTRAVDRFLVLSNASAELLQRHGIPGERISVVPQYIWTQATQAPLPDEPVLGKLVYVGWVERRKGLHVIVEALGKLAAEFPALHLDVLGLPADPRYQQEIQERSASLNISDRIHFLGKQNREELLKRIQGAHLVTIPEQWENMSPVILTEAMAAGACVLASRIGGIQHFVQDYRNGLLAERDGVMEYAEKIRWAMVNSEALPDIRRTARIRAQELFGTETVNQQLLAAYRQTIAHPTSGKTTNATD